MKPPSNIETLRLQLAQQEGVLPHLPAERSASPALDALLPGHGWRRGWLVEWLAAGTGAEALALRVAQPFFAQGEAVVIDRRGEFYPPAAAAVGVPLERLTIVRPPDEAAELWAFEQTLLCSGVSVAWLWREKISPRDFRRLQLAAESSLAIGFIFRPWNSRQQPTWSHVQWGVNAVGKCGVGSGWRLRVELLRCRGQGNLGFVELELPDEARVGEQIHAAPLAGRMGKGTQAG